MGKHQKTQLDAARDELMSHVVRCDVFRAEMDDRMEWLDETMEYMAERYPGLSDLELAQLKIIGTRFIKPPIRHGAGNSAHTRDENLEERVEAEIEEKGEAEVIAEAEVMAA